MLNKILQKAPFKLLRNRNFCFLPANPAAKAHTDTMECCAHAKGKFEWECASRERSGAQRRASLRGSSQGTSRRSCLRGDVPSKGSPSIRPSRRLVKGLPASPSSVDYALRSLRTALWTLPNESEICIVSSSLGGGQIAGGKSLGEGKRMHRRLMGVAAGDSDGCPFGRSGREEPVLRARQSRQPTSIGSD